MKRLCLILAFLFLFAQTSSALLLPTPKVVYRGTVTGLRISSVNGTAFIDNAGATIPTYADGNHQIEIYDASNRMLRGVLKAAGTSEGLGADLLSGWDFTSGWTPKATTTINDNNTFTAGDGSGYVKKTIAITGLLFKSTIVGTVSVGTLQILDGATSTIANNATPIYRTATFNDIMVYNGFTSNGSVTDITSMSMYQVTAPSSGATIVSAKGGETYNFSYKNPSFKYNAASYYVIIRAIR